MIRPAHISDSLEDYIEAIYHIVKEKSAAKPRDLADRLRVSSASVTGALKLLAEKSLINYAPYDVITLTEKGRACAEDVARRHEVLRDFLVNIFAVEYKEADEAACAMEHSVPAPILERFVRFAEFAALCGSGGGADWVASFRAYCEKGARGGAGAVCPGERRGQQAPAVKLSGLKPGRRGRVLKSAVPGPAGRRLLEMGLTSGALVEVERVAPLGDPMNVKVRGYHLSLRREEAEGVTVEPL